MVNKPSAVVEELANDYRTARLNMYYYGRKLTRLTWTSVVIDIAIAIGTSGAVASLAVMKTHDASTALAVFTAASAILSVIKPFLKLPGRIEKMSKTWSGWNAQFYSLKGLVEDVKANDALSETTLKAYNAARERRGPLSTNDDPNPDRKLLKELQAVINQEIPIESLPVLAA